MFLRGCDGVANIIIASYSRSNYREGTCSLRQGGTPAPGAPGAPMLPTPMYKHLLISVDKSGLLSSVCSRRSLTISFLLLQSTHTHCITGYMYRYMYRGRVIMSTMQFMHAVLTMMWFDCDNKLPRITKLELSGMLPFYNLIVYGKHANIQQYTLMVADHMMTAYIYWSYYRKWKELGCTVYAWVDWHCGAFACRRGSVAEIEATKKRDPQIVSFL